MFGIVFLSLLLQGAAEKKASTKASLDQVKHLIVFMQENRPFDHYFGTMKGVRGFNDRTPPVLSTGRDSFYQPIDATNPDLYMLPFRTIANETNAMCMPAPLMAYTSDMGIWNHGRMDGWNTARDAGYGMAYFTREDLPYYYTLYDNFVVADQYFQSTFTCTNPNRMHLFTGSNGLSMDQGCVLDNAEPRPGYNWTTVAETLTEKGVSWKVYQEYENFDDNAFAWFRTFQESRPGDLLHDQGLKRYANLFDEMDKDMSEGTLPTVSWVIAPSWKSEHATNHPCAGEDFTARVLQVLQKHPEVYKNTLFVLNYDEGGQFYDHALTYTPPMSEDEGYSFVTVHGEVNKEVSTSEPAPIGLGFRVPAILISPWTRGNLVYSEVLDHTSVLQFMEQWLGISVDTISPWRRLVTGDLTAALDFDHPDYSWPTNFPDTSKYVSAGDVECHTLPDPIIPSEQHMPHQEPGTRTSRALPYEVSVHDTVLGDGRTLQVSVQNTGSVGVPLVLFDMQRLSTALPRQLALAPSTTFTYVDNTITSLRADETSSASNATNNHAEGDYAAVLLGPNGFLREFRGNTASCSAVGTAGVSVTAKLIYSPATEDVQVEVQVTGTVPTTTSEVRFTVSDPAYGLLTSDMVVDVPVVAGSTASKTVTVNTAKSGHWYDLIVSAALSSSSSSSTDVSCMYRRFMGRMETGADSISDPAMAAGVENWLHTLQHNKYPGLHHESKKEQHPPLPAHITRQVHHKPSADALHNKDARFFSKDFPADRDL